MMENKILQSYVQGLTSKFGSISEKRKEVLTLIAKEIAHRRNQNQDVAITVVCTHNSRRSQLGEIWIETACQYYGIDGIKAFSGGTEVTAFNIRMVVALRHVGFHLHTEQPGDNPRYELTALTSSARQHLLFSKTYNDPFNPQERFIAIIVCGEADEACPTVFGASARYSLPYLDPKEFDDTPFEHEAYLDKVEEMGIEFLFLIAKAQILSTPHPN